MDDPTNYIEIEARMLRDDASYHPTVQDAIFELMECATDFDNMMAEAGFYQALNEIRAAVWDEGFDACANWWEIHHHGLKRDDTNPYRTGGDDDE